MVSALLAVLLAGIGTWWWLGPPEPGYHRSSRTAAGLRHRNPGSPQTTAGRATDSGHRRRHPDRAGDAEEYAGFIRQLAALLRAGTGPGAAFGLLAGIWATGTGPVAADVHAGTTRALTQLHTGGTLQQGFYAHAEDSTRDGGNQRLWTRLAWCLAICEESGAALADLLDTLAEDAETSADMHRALQAALAGPRATSRLLTYLPAIGLGLGQLLGINPVLVLTGHPAGRISLVVGICLWLGNRLWCARLLRAVGNKVPV